MLKKIGFTTMPSLRGTIWEIDAPNCQGCSSQFNFINRKHHCRRCGGIFCNSCSQYRMILRGEGDFPVRICEPCKKLEEAARFEMRHGHNRVGKGSLKLTIKDEDEVMNQILGGDEKESSSSRLASKNLSGEDVQNEITSTSPEELRQSALDEKKKYKTLKAKGKHDEALRAFKRGKELERQAEISMRKSRKKDSLPGSNTEILSEDAPKELGRKIKPPRQVSKGNGDLASEIRGLGWADTDLRGDDKEAAGVSLEGELSSLLGEIPRKTDAHGTDKSEVVALKKKALMLKREGNLAEAKEELKRAKVLEKQLEEQELSAGAEDSDDELSALVRSMDNNKLDGMILQQSENFDFDHLVGTTDDFDINENLEVTEEDMEDPEIATALESLGWTEDLNHTEIIISHSASAEREATLSEVFRLKREALNQKRSGNVSEAMAQLKKAKLLERDLENFDEADSMSPQTTMVGGENISSAGVMDPKPAPKSRLAIQKELLGLKKKALALRREGRIDESDEELKKGQILERQLEEMDSALNKKTKQVSSGSKNMDLIDEHLNLSENLSERGGGGEVTDQDMQDPSYLSVLKNLGWNEEDYESSSTQARPKIPAKLSKRTKAEIQRELLGLKRKALTLRRQGNTDEAEEVLEKTKALEVEVEEMEAPKKLVESIVESSITDALEGGDNEVVTENDTNNPALASPLKDLGWKDEESLTEQEKPVDETIDCHSSSGILVAVREMQEDTVSSNKQDCIKQDVLLHKRKAVALKREGKLTEAREELRQAKLLEKILVRTITNEVSTSASTAAEERGASNSGAKKLSGRDRFTLQQESLSHKRQALKLRREGLLQEAEAEFELAKALEAQLEELTADDSTKSVSEDADDVVVEDLLDPQLLSALKAIGFDDDSIIMSLPPDKESENISQERAQLQERIKSEKMKAVNLKRSGKQAEALDALRRAKLFEKKLKSLTSYSSK